MRNIRSSVTLLAIAISSMLTLSACRSAPQPENLDTAPWMPEHAVPYDSQCGQPESLPPPPQATQVPPETLRAAPAIVAPGDRLRVDVMGDSGDLSSLYVIDEYGQLDMPGLPAIDTTQQSVKEIETRLGQLLVREQLVRPLPRVAAVSLVERAGIFVFVQGSVFNEGTVRVGERPVENRVGQREGPATGDANTERSLSAALRAAGGVRPDADLAHVRVLRGERWTEIDLTGLLSGEVALDLRLAAQDRIYVPTTHCFAPELIRPSPVTPPGIRIYMSNLSRPAASNATSAIGKETTSLPYGTRLLQGLVAANCVGGSAMNAHREAILISTNPFNGETFVMARDVEAMLESADRDRVNPYLMPGDALACYDSRWMNVRDAISMAGDALGPAATVILINDVSQ
ncbi:polysaccharide biosynthesis/export family protein [Salinicola aestuarinus]|uniref:polysaccharide biosynthesis/export family protein n=1 Tax=Salinicola aestuarinus TaxID=1949082 RepID=UPI000DA23514|nr:hypothetical protein [Salinicola aestuarinus]